jgi:hypothetical protein
MRDLLDDYNRFAATRHPLRPSRGHQRMGLGPAAAHGNDGRIEDAVSTEVPSISR